MELQFQETAFRCLRSSAADTRSAEQTLEVRLPENMPPISRVLGAWGQPLIRGKEWGGDQVSVNGGVMAHALYEGEDGGVYCVEGWMPFRSIISCMCWHTPSKFVLMSELEYLRTSIPKELK